MTTVIVVGGGVGGMVAALRARAHGATVVLVEARSALGGLASGLEFDDTTFDGGPYILLDRVRLGWAFDQVGLDLESIPLVELDPAYRLTAPADREALSIFSDLEAAAESIERADPGTGERYRTFVHEATKGLDRLAPMLVHGHDPLEAIRTGAWRAAAWAGLSLDQVLRRHDITGAAADAVRIWTYIAGGDPKRAPGPLALVPALIHRDGAARPAAGIHRIVSVLERELTERGVGILRSARVVSINHDQQPPRRVRGVTIDNGEHLTADVVISDIGGAAALLDLVDAKPPLALRLRMAGPLQSPGVSAYLKVRGTPPAEINFEVSGRPKRATAFIASGDGTGRLIAPLASDDARRLGEDGQQRMLDALVAASWWREGIEDAEVVGTRLVTDWSREFSLRDDAMNLVMARRQLLLGRLPHRIRHLPGLYLTGSWTHPGQWISFCSVSGVLAADAAMEATPT